MINARYRGSSRDQARHNIPQNVHRVGSGPARSASRPSEKKQIDTMTAHVGNPALLAILLRFGHETTAISKAQASSWAYPLVS